MKLAQRLVHAILRQPNAVTLAREVMELLHANPTVNPNRSARPWIYNEAATQYERWWNGSLVARVHVEEDSNPTRILWHIEDPSTLPKTSAWGSHLAEDPDEVTACIEAAKKDADNALIERHWTVQWKLRKKA